MKNKNKDWSLKRATYMFLSIIIGLMLGTIFHWLAEVWWINYAFSHSRTLVLHNNLGSSCYLTWQIEFGLLALGLALGIKLGFWGWRVVYVEHRRR